MCFDTTSSNTGIRIGACTLIEKQLLKYLMYLACRHHMHERIVSHVFKCSFGLTSGGPDVLLFKLSKEKWNFINQNEIVCFGGGNS